MYRHFATLYFVFIVDEAESELATLDLIQGAAPRTFSRTFSSLLAESSLPRGARLAVTRKITRKITHCAFNLKDGCCGKHIVLP